MNLLAQRETHVTILPNGLMKENLNLNSNSNYKSYSNDFDFTSLQAFLINKLMPKGFKLESKEVLEAPSQNKSKSKNKNKNISKNKRQKIDAYGLPVNMNIKKEVPYKPKPTFISNCIFFHTQSNTGIDSIAETYEEDEDISEGESEVLASVKQGNIYNVCNYNSLIDPISFSPQELPNNVHNNISFTPLIEVKSPVIDISPYGFSSFKQISGVQAVDDLDDVCNISSFDDDNNNNINKINKFPQQPQQQEHHQAQEGQISLSQVVANTPAVYSQTPLNVLNRDADKTIRTRNFYRNSSSSKKLTQEAEVANKKENVDSILTELKELKEKYNKIEKELKSVKNKQNAPDVSRSKSINNRNKNTHNKTTNKNKNNNTKSSNANATAKPTVASGRGGVKKNITDEEKNILAVNLNQLSIDEKKDMRIIIKDYIKIKKGGEFEFNINELPNEVFNKLKKYVDDCMNKSNKSNNANNVNNSAKKNIVKVSTSQSQQQSNNVHVNSQHLHEIPEEKEGNNIHNQKNNNKPLSQFSSRESTYESENSEKNKKTFIGAKRNFLLDDSSLSSSSSSSSSSDCKINYL